MWWLGVQLRPSKQCADEPSNDKTEAGSDAGAERSDNKQWGGCFWRANASRGYSDFTCCGWAAASSHKRQSLGLQPQQSQPAAYQAWCLAVVG